MNKLTISILAAAFAFGTLHTVGAHNVVTDTAKDTMKCEYTVPVCHFMNAGKILVATPIVTVALVGVTIIVPVVGAVATVTETAAGIGTGTASLLGFDVEPKPEPAPQPAPKASKKR